MTTTTRARANTTPATATGSVAWLSNDPITYNPRIRITSQTQRGPVVHEYEVERLRSDIYRLWRIDPATFTLIYYEVKVGKTPEATTCNCPDAQHRRGMGACKHARGLWKALDALPF